MIALVDTVYLSTLQVLVLLSATPQFGIVFLTATCRRSKAVRKEPEMKQYVEHGSDHCDFFIDFFFIHRVEQH